jgi:16S rRNA A1518/A1519 N6-dimethyltransferase RsmA/KsgA/DIM1 with predicted DNA glycosylase/AP lyase activity
VLTIENISTLKFSSTGATPEEIKHFFRIVRAGFAHKRKLLARNLEEVATKEAIETAFTSLNLSPLTRAETVPTEIWIELAKKL